MHRLPAGDKHAAGADQESLGSPDALGDAALDRSAFLTNPPAISARSTLLMREDISRHRHVKNLAMLNDIQS